MALLTETEMRRRATQARSSVLAKSLEPLDSILNEQVTKQEKVAAHDIFLSHAFDDKELIYGVALTLEDKGYSVYLDWRDDPKLDRTKVTPKTASALRNRMRASKCLLFSTSDASSNSKWMPWELGFKDGLDAKVAILPITKASQSSYKGQEYVGLYPYTSEERDTKQRSRLWINQSEKIYVSFDQWLAGKQPYLHD